MPKPSIYQQMEAVQVNGPFMQPSPRHWNMGLLRYKGRLWGCYRYHLSRQHESRCAIGLVPLDKVTLKPTAPSQHLNLPAVVGDEHFEDARLFMFNGAPHISYTQMTGYRPGVDYKCIIKYARLKLQGNRWLIEEVFYPQYGRNGGASKEKNWSFFEHDGGLYVIYEDQPTRRIVRLERDRPVQEFLSEEPLPWPWGVVRGGAPPVLINGEIHDAKGNVFGNGKHFLTIFHSSLATEVEPHFVRYYGAAYIFEAKPPFKIVAVSSKPIMAGSETDGHGEDPRYSNGWKPFVVFPCGCVPDGDDWLVSLGVNDWQCTVARLKASQLNLISPDRSDAPMRYFATTNGSLPVKMFGADGQPAWLSWEVAGSNLRGNMALPGLYATTDGRESEALEDAPRAEEITAEQYLAAGGRSSAARVRLAVPQFG